MGKIGKKTGSPKRYQIDVLRNALTYEYKMLGSYNKVSLAIKQSTGRSISEDTIERFLTNITGKPQSRHLDTISHYLESEGLLINVQVLSAPTDFAIPTVLHRLFLSSGSGEDFGTELNGTYVLKSVNGVNENVYTKIVLKLVDGKKYWSAKKNVSMVLEREKKSIETNSQGELKIYEYIGWVFQSNHQLIFLYEDRYRHFPQIWKSMGYPFNSSSSRIDHLMLSTFPKLENQRSSSFQELFGSKQDYNLCLDVELFERRDFFDNEESMLYRKEGVSSDQLDEFVSYNEKSIKLFADCELEFTQNKEKESLWMEQEKIELAERLIESIRNFDYDKAKELLKSGAPINYQDSWGHAPIHHAAIGADPDMVEILMSEEWGEKCNALLRNNEGHLPSTCALLGTVNESRWPFVEMMTNIELEQGKAIGIIPKISGDVPFNFD